MIVDKKKIEEISKNNFHKNLYENLDTYISKNHTFEFSCKLMT